MPAKPPGSVFQGDDHRLRHPVARANRQANPKYCASTENRHVPPSPQSSVVSRPWSVVRVSGRDLQCRSLQPVLVLSENDGKELETKHPLQLPTADCRLPTADCQLPTANC